MLARQSLGVPGTASFLPFGAMIFPCFFPFMYRHPVLISVRTKAATSLLLLYRMVNHFANLDLHPDVVSDRVLSDAYEELILKFASSVNEKAGEFMIMPSMNLQSECHLFVAA